VRKLRTQPDSRPSCSGFFPNRARNVTPHCAANRVCLLTFVRFFHSFAKTSRKGSSLQSLGIRHTHLRTVSFDSSPAIPGDLLCWLISKANSDSSGEVTINVQKPIPKEGKHENLRRDNPTTPSA